MTTTAGTTTLDSLTASVAHRRAARATRRRVLRSRRVQIGAALTVVIVALALSGPFFSPHPVSALLGIPFQAPGSGSPLGLDYLGRDVLSRVLSGGRNLVWMSLACAAIGMLLGVPAGMLAGFSGGWRDEVIMRIGDVLLALPVIVFAMLFVALLGAELWLLVLVIGVAHAPQVARVTRGVTADIRHREYIECAVAMGMPRRKILASEVLPNIITPLTVEFGIRVVWSIAAIASLSVLGSGIQPPTADWGLMVNENLGGLAVQPLGVTIPILCIALFALGVNLLTEGIARAVAGTDRKGSE